MEEDDDKDIEGCDVGEGSREAECGTPSLDVCALTEELIAGMPVL